MYGIYTVYSYFTLTIFLPILTYNISNTYILLLLLLLLLLPLLYTNYYILTTTTPLGCDIGQDLLPVSAHQDQVHGAGSHPQRGRR